MPFTIKMCQKEINYTDRLLVTHSAMNQYFGLHNITPMWTNNTKDALVWSNAEVVNIVRMSKFSIIIRINILTCDEYVELLNAILGCLDTRILPKPNLIWICCIGGTKTMKKMLHLWEFLFRVLYPIQLFHSLLLKQNNGIHN